MQIRKCCQEPKIHHVLGIKYCLKAGERHMNKPLCKNLYIYFFLSLVHASAIVEISGSVYVINMY